MEMPPVPPPLPAKSRFGRWKVLLIVLGALGAAALLFVGSTALFMLTAQSYEPTAEQRAAVLTVEDVEAWYEIDLNEGEETWEATRYLDTSKEIFYFYTDEDISLDCTITIERNRSDAVTSYLAEWAALKLGNRVDGGGKIGLEREDAFFSWGDTSQFAFQTYEGERHGFVFITRSGNQIFFVDAWGFLIDEREEMAAFLTPKLRKFEATSF
ncbi:MAG: hypothetical protein ACQKBY_02185 [Verrucomicrobiales bacterium]